jgi:formylmethanofuran dehydrogenase subunit B
LVEESGQIVQVDRGCAMAQEWYRGRTSPRAPSPSAEQLAARYDHATALLRAARAPLITGLAQASLATIRASIALADELGAYIDPLPASVAVARSLARVGEVGCTLGEVRHRADLVLFWGCDPVRTHPRFFERFLDPPGRFIPRGRADRTVVVLTREPNATTPLADHVFPLALGDSWQALRAIRLHLAGRTADPTWKPLAQMVRAARFAVLFTGEELLADTPAPDRVLDELTRLVQDQNAFSRCSTRRLKMLPSSGAESVLAWQTGYPQAVGFTAGYPRSALGEWSARTLVDEQAVDCVVLVGTEGLENWPQPSRDRLAELPLIRFDPPEAPAWPPAIVRFETGVPGLHLPGEITRLDDVVLPMRPLWPNTLPDAAPVLETLLARLRLDAAAQGR